MAVFFSVGIISILKCAKLPANTMLVVTTCTKHNDHVPKTVSNFTLVMQHNSAINYLRLVLINSPSKLNSLKGRSWLWQAIMEILDAGT